MPVDDDWQFCYLGPGRVYLASGVGLGKIYIHCLDPKLSLSHSDLADIRFCRSPSDSSYQANLDAIYARLADASLPDILDGSLPHFTRSAHTIAEVPNFRQWDWTNIMPQTNSCAVMATASANLLIPRSIFCRATSSKTSCFATLSDPYVLEVQLISHYTIFPSNELALGLS